MPSTPDHPSIDLPRVEARAVRVGTIYRKPVGAELVTATARIDLLTTADTLMAFEVVTPDLRHVLRGIEHPLVLWRHHTPDAWFTPEQAARLADHATADYDGTRSWPGDLKDIDWFAPAPRLAGLAVTWSTPDAWHLTLAVGPMGSAGTVEMDAPLGIVEELWARFYDVARELVEAEGSSI